MENRSDSIRQPASESDQAVRERYAAAARIGTVPNAGVAYLGAKMKVAFGVKMKVARASECAAHDTVELAGIEIDQALRVGHVASATTVGFARGLNDTPKILGLMVGASVIDPALGAGVLAIEATIAPT